MKGKVLSVSRGRRIKVEEFYIPSVSFLLPLMALTLAEAPAEPHSFHPRALSAGEQGRLTWVEAHETPQGFPPPFPLGRARRTQPLPPPWTPDPRPWGAWEIPREERHGSASSDPWGNHIRISSLPKRRGPCWFTPTCSLGLLIWCISTKMR